MDAKPSRGANAQSGSAPPSSARRRMRPGARRCPVDGAVNDLFKLVPGLVI